MLRADLRDLAADRSAAYVSEPSSFVDSERGEKWNGKWNESGKSEMLTDARATRWYSEASGCLLERSGETSKLTFQICHGEPVAVDPRCVDVRIKGPEGRRAHIVETLQHESQQQR